MSQLREQDHLFTVLEKGADGNQPIVIGAVHECLNARLDSLAAIIEKILRAAGSDCLADHYGKKATASIRRPGNWIRRIRALFTIWRIRRCRSQLRVF